MIRKVIPTAFADTYENDPSRRGECAARKRLFGDCSRYAVAPVHTRFDKVQWFVWDAEHPYVGEYGPEVIRQAETFQEAMVGFEDYLA